MVTSGQNSPKGCLSGWWMTKERHEANILQEKPGRENRGTRRAQQNLEIQQGWTWFYYLGRDLISCDILSLVPTMVQRHWWRHQCVRGPGVFGEPSPSCLSPSPTASEQLRRELSRGNHTGGALCGIRHQSVQGEILGVLEVYRAPKSIAVCGWWQCWDNSNLAWLQEANSSTGHLWNHRKLEDL